MDNKDLEDVAPTAEMQLGEDKIKQLVIDADLGGRSNVGIHGKVMFAVGLAWVVFQLWYASPLPFVFGFWVFNDTEARSIHLAIGAVPRLPRVSCQQALAARLRSGARLGPRVRRRVRRRVPVPVLQRTGDSAEAADHARCGRRRLRDPAAAGSDAARGRLADDGACDAISRLHDRRRVPARRDRPQRRVDPAHDLAHVAAHRGRVSASRSACRCRSSSCSCCSARCSIARAAATT